jgi:hypothetical protein
MGTPAENFDLPELKWPPPPELLTPMQQLGASLGVRIIGESPDF